MGLIKIGSYIKELQIKSDDILANQEYIDTEMGKIRKENLELKTRLQAIEQLQQQPKISFIGKLARMLENAFTTQKR